MVLEKSESNEKDEPEKREKKKENIDPFHEYWCRVVIVCRMTTENGEDMKSWHMHIMNNDSWLGYISRDLELTNVLLLDY